ncbi:MAG: hypothetical protein KDN20_06115 [Verrucomicrobiae bacterium]|nr:hypothetical protein [Verrucomicrobiae bacterium]
MRTILWGDGTRYDNPNARWGSPAYLLLPGNARNVVSPKRVGHGNLTRD